MLRCARDVTMEEVLDVGSGSVELAQTLTIKPLNPELMHMSRAPGR